MKKNYEKNQLIISISFIFLILCFLFIVNIFTYRYRNYKVLNSVLITKNYIKLIIADEDLKKLKGSKYIFIDDKKKKMEIIEIVKNVLKKEENYHEVIVNAETPDKYHDGDYIKVTIYDNKKRLINIFKSCWKE